MAGGCWTFDAYSPPEEDSTFISFSFDLTGRCSGQRRRSYETTNVDVLDQQCSGGVYPRLNGGDRRCPPTNRLSEFIDDNRQAPGGDKPRHYDGSFFLDLTGRSSGQRRRSYETTDSWNN